MSNPDLKPRRPHGHVALLVVAVSVVVMLTSCSTNEPYFEGAIEDDAGERTAWSARVTDSQLCTEVEGGASVCVAMPDESLADGGIEVESSTGAKVAIAGVSNAIVDRVVIEFPNGFQQETALGPVADGQTPFAWALSSSVGSLGVTFRAYSDGTEVASASVEIGG